MINIIARIIQNSTTAILISQFNIGPIIGIILRIVAMKKTISV